MRDVTIREIPKPPLPDFVAPEPIVVDGQTRLRQEPSDFLALGHNPLLTAGMIAQLAPVLSERRIAMQDLLLAHAENTEQMLSPEFTHVDLKDPTTLISARAVLAPLGELGPLGNKLNSTGFMNNTMRRLTQTIGASYQNALLGAVRSENPDVAGEDATTGSSNSAIGQIIFEYTVAEPKFAFGLLAANLFDDLDATLNAVSISPASAGMLREAAPMIAGSTNFAHRAAEANKAITNVTLTERQELMKYAVSLRPNPEFEMPADDASFNEMTNEQRVNALLAAYAGHTFDWSSYIKTE